MLRYFIAFFAAFVALATARAVQHETLRFPATTPDTASCCLPIQWSAKVSILDSIGSKNMNYLDSQTDYESKKQVMFYGTLKNQDSKVLIDFDKGMMYTVLADSTCYKMPLKLPMVQCIPKDAEYLGSSYMGPMGAGQLEYDGWRIRSSGNATINVVYTLAISKNQCVPLVEGAHYPDGNIPDQHFMFWGFQPKLTDPSAFKLPKSCFE